MHRTPEERRLEEDVLLTVKFCNKIRAVGNQEPIDDLIPGSQNTMTGCPVALSVNHYAAVYGTGNNRWWMAVRCSRELATMLAEAAGTELKEMPGTRRFKILLPPYVARVASAVDEDELPKYVVGGWSSDE